MLTHAQRNQLKRILLDRRGEVLAAQNGAPSLEQRQLLALLDERLHAIRSGGFGLCHICGAPLSFEQLKAAPLRSNCPGCLAEQAGAMA